MGSKKFVCTNCHYLGKRTKETQGSCLIELILWLFMILPGVIYSIWRLTTRKRVCPKCKKESMIPTDTPKGKELLQQVEDQENSSENKE